MNIPKGMTEEEVLSSIDRVANGLAYKYRFGYHGLDDMKQEARMLAIEGLDRYDSSRGKLETFLWTHVSNRLFNIKRNKYARPDKPCFDCPLALVFFCKLQQFVKRYNLVRSVPFA